MFSRISRERVEQTMDHDSNTIHYNRFGTRIRSRDLRKTLCLVLANASPKSNMMESGALGIDKDRAVAKSTAGRI